MGWRASAARIAAFLLPLVTATYTVSDADGLGLELHGFGALSGGGATSRFLIDYVEPSRSDILDLLFKPGFGASIHILKVEVGGDADSTNGAEASHMRAPGEAVFTRGYEWWLMKEAKARNPDLLLYALPWAWPHYLAGDTQATSKRGNPWSNLSATSEYIVSYLTGAREVHALHFDYLGLWNEVGSSMDYAIVLRAALDAANFSSVKLIAADATFNFDIAETFASNSTVRNALWGLGAHYVGSYASPSARNLSMPLWVSEDNSQSGYLGGACVARALSENYANSHLTASINWALAAAFYPDIRWFGAMLLNAPEPWSGAYALNPALWAMAHYTQFSAPGWRYALDGAGVGYLDGGGTYTTLVEPGQGHFSLMIEKIDRSFSCRYEPPPPNSTTFEVANFALGGSFISVTQLFVWYSNFSHANRDTNVDDLFRPLPPVAVVGGRFSLAISVGDLFTLSTLATAAHGVPATPPPPSAPFPAPYSDPFNASSYAPGGMPLYWSNLNGAFDLSMPPADAPRAAGARAAPAGAPLALLLDTRGQPVLWAELAATRPNTIVGDATWSDVDAEVDFLVDAAAPRASGCVLLAVRACCDIDVLPGIWLALCANGTWAVHESLPDVDHAPRASGLLPAGSAAAGTWHTLRATARGNTTTFALDGAAPFAVVDVAAGFPSQGWLALAGKSWDDVIYFGAPAVRVLPDACAVTAAGAVPAGTPLTVRACDGANAFKRFLWSGGAISPAADPLTCVAAQRSAASGLLYTFAATCNASDVAQRWTIVPHANASAASTGELVRVTHASGDCLETAGTSVAVGLEVDVYKCHGASPGAPIDSNQLWSWPNATSGAAPLVNDLSGLCAAFCVPQ